MKYVSTSMFKLTAHDFDFGSLMKYWGIRTCILKTWLPAFKSATAWYERPQHAGIVCTNIAMISGPLTSLTPHDNLTFDNTFSSLIMNNIRQGRIACSNAEGLCILSIDLAWTLEKTGWYREVQGRVDNIVNWRSTDAFIDKSYLVWTVQMNMNLVSKRPNES